MEVLRTEKSALYNGEHCDNPVSFFQRVLQGTGLRKSQRSHFISFPDEMNSEWFVRCQNNFDRFKITKDQNFLYSAYPAVFFLFVFN